MTLMVHIFSLKVIETDDLTLSTTEKYHEMIMPVLNLVMTVISMKNNQSRFSAKV